MKIRSRGRLPHWEIDGAIYFVTFRLYDSLPREVVRAFEFERWKIIATARRMKRDQSETERRRLKQLFSEKIEKYLNAGTGACYLRQSGVAKLMVGALRHFDGKRYRLIAWCVMPNHVHVVFQAIEGYGLAQVVRSWKLFTARFANRLLRRTGPFWQREYYDHIVRDEQEFWRVVDYVAKNPERAGLKNWPWVEVLVR
jgi:REP element-mobilizing transposase RayT